MMNYSRVRSTTGESKKIQLINYASITYSFFSARKARQSLTKYLFSSKFRFDRFDLGLLPEPMPMVPTKFRIKPFDSFFSYPADR